MKILGAFLVALASLSYGADTLTLNDAVRIGLEQSPAIKIAKSQYEQARQQSRQALGQLGFRLDGQASYQRFSPGTSFGPGSGTQYDSKTGALVLSYPVDFAQLGRKASLAARENENAALKNVDVQKNLITRTIRDSYFNVIRAKEGVGVRETALASIQATRDNLQKRFAVGEIPRFDVLRLDTEVSKAESDLIQARNNYTLSKQVLNNNLNRPVDTEFEVEELSDLPPKMNPETDYVAMAMSTRAEIQQLKNFLQARKFVTYTERGGLTPSLNLGAQQSFNIDPSAFQNSSQTTLSATLRIPLFDSGITKAKIREAKEEEIQVEQNIEQVSLGISLEVRSAMVRLQNAYDQLRVAKKVVELQQEALRLAKLRYENQVGILLDVTVAQSDLTLAQNNLLNAQYEVRSAYAGLQQAVGTDDLPQTSE